VLYRFNVVILWKKRENALAHPIHLHMTVPNTTTTYDLQQYTAISNTTSTTVTTSVYLYVCGDRGACAYSAVHLNSIYICIYIHTHTHTHTMVSVAAALDENKTEGKGNSIWGWKNIGFYGDFRLRMQSKHNSHVYIPPWFYWIAGSQWCHKGHKMAVLFILVSPWLLWNDVSEVFWITSLRGGNATPPPSPCTIFYTFI